MAFLLLIFSVVTVSLGWPLLRIIQNYHEARQIGLPIVITPFALRNLFWMFTQSFIAPLLKRLPFGLASFLDYSTRDWYFRDRYHLSSRLGPAFIIVSPGPTQLILADPEAVEDLLARRKDFDKPEDLYKPLEVFGANVNTVVGETWQRHRRITTPPFNEKNSNLVWRESLAQAGGMLGSWIDKGQAGVTRTNSAMMTLALHVLTAAGFGKSYEFEGGVGNPGEGHNLSYRDSLKTILENLVLALVAQPIMRLSPSILPQKVSAVQDAIKEFKQYMAEMVAEERASIEVNRDNLMSVLVRASQEEMQKGKGRNGLTDEEIFGNLFIYNLAGHDTTANTLAYAVCLLASDTHWQNWIGDEIDAVFGTNEDEVDWDYERVFPKLKRCLAVMYETLRLYGPVIYVPRYTTSSQTLIIKGKEHSIPPGTYVTLHIAALHSLPQHWGFDTLTWRPDRWLLPESEELLTPHPGTFLPWIAGPRVCPGKKFAQVEFVAVIARLFRRHRVRMVQESGESQKEADEKAKALIEDSKLSVTLSIKHPEKIKLLWEELG